MSAPSSRVPSSLPGRLEGVTRRLARAYGRPRRRRGDPLDTLIATVLSQNTSDVNSRRAFDALKSAYPSWEQVAEARPDAVERRIRSGGLARTKSRRIVSLLKALRARDGRLDLSVLRSLDPQRAQRYLEGLPGVGPKTRACVLLFGCGHPAFPVDTHVLRVSRRLGLISPGTGAVEAHRVLEPAVPKGRALDLHLNLIRLGREVCRARAPRCGECPLAGGCPSRREAA